MSEAIQLIRRHIEAMERSDWTAVQASMSDAPILALIGIDDWSWSVSQLYRHITQAWDFSVTDIRLHEDDGVVTGVIKLASGDWKKDVWCQYLVADDRIVSITFTDGRPYNTADTP